MAKGSIRVYSTTAASNTDVGGVDIQGTAPASNMDDSVRELMSHLAETNAGTAPVDDTWSFCDPADATKKVRLDAGSVTAGQTRVLTVPNFDGTIATLAGTETFTNKTLTSPTLNTPTIATPTITGLAASTTAAGIVELATDAEAQTGTDTARAITAANLQAVTATTTRKGVAELATEAEVATGTDTARVPSVSTMGSHQGMAKAWVNFNGTGTPAIVDSFNVTSITDNGAGDYTINFTNAMANINYVVAGSANDNGLTGPSNPRILMPVTPLTTSCRVVVVNTTGDGIDVEYVHVVIFGD